jgi:DNA repair exonuclease SbcCD ATPase subunit
LDALKKLLTPAIVLPPPQPGQPPAQSNNDALKQLSDELERLRKLLATPPAQPGQPSQPTVENEELNALKILIIELQTQLANALRAPGSSVQDETELNRLRAEVESLKQQLKKCQDDAAAALAAKDKELQTKQTAIDLLQNNEITNLPQIATCLPIKSL